MKLKNIVVFILIIIFSSCKEKDTCYPEFKKSLSYIKEHIDPNNNEFRLNKEVEHNLVLLESISGILNQYQDHNILNVRFITQNDISKWEAWVSKKCDSLNNND